MALHAWLTSTLRTAKLEWTVFGHENPIARRLKLSRAYRGVAQRSADFEALLVCPLDLLDVSASYAALLTISASTALAVVNLHGHALQWEVGCVSQQPLAGIAGWYLN